MDDKKKKKFVVPEAEIIDFSEEDIITSSSGEDRDDWGNGLFDGDDF